MIQTRYDAYKPPEKGASSVGYHRRDSFMDRVKYLPEILKIGVIWIKGIEKMIAESSNVSRNYRSKREIGRNYLSVSHTSHDLNPFSIT